MQKMMWIMNALMPVEILPQDEVMKRDARYIGTEYYDRGYEGYTDVYEDKATGELIGYESRKGYSNA